MNQTSTFMDSHSSLQNRGSIEEPAVAINHASSSDPEIIHVARQFRSSPTFVVKHQTLINFWLDVLLLVNFLALLWVSVVVQFVFPPAEASAGYVLWGLALSQWMDVQFGILSVFLLGIVVHLMLHWSWICGIINTRIWRSRSRNRAMDDGQRTILGVGLMIVVLNLMGIGIAIASLAIKTPI